MRSVTMMGSEEIDIWMGTKSSHWSCNQRGLMLREDYTAAHKLIVPAASDRLSGQDQGRSVAIPALQRRNHGVTGNWMKWLFRSCNGQCAQKANIMAHAKESFAALICRGFCK